MGTIRGGKIIHTTIPTQLVLQLKEDFKVSDFIETGTCMGMTTQWAAKNFNRVLTIEKSEILYKRVTARLGNLPNVRFAFGDSREVLKKICPTLSEPSIFWLDSHWSGGETSGEEDECPLLEELEIIKTARVPQMLFIDDAKYFLELPPPPHKKAHWPKIDEITSTLQSGNFQYVISVINDTMIALPEEAKEWLFAYCDRVHEAQTSEDVNYQSAIQY